MSHQHLNREEHRRRRLRCVARFRLAYPKRAARRERLERSYGPYRDQVRLMQQRISAGMSREDLAAALRVNYSTLTKWELGQRKIPALMVQRIRSAIRGWRISH
jgi:ribosome-binding protein aMBF1 (putative translation factor)